MKIMSLMLIDDMAMKYGNIIKYLPIEITENAAVSDMKIHKLTQKLAKYGFVLHRDDFEAVFFYSCGIRDTSFHNTQAR